jgi:hypothetical protein
MRFAEPPKIRRTVKDCEGVKMRSQLSVMDVLQEVYPKKLPATLLEARFKSLSIRQPKSCLLARVVQVAEAQVLKHRVMARAGSTAASMDSV